MPFSNTGLFIADEDKFEFTVIDSESESESESETEEDSHDQISNLGDENSNSFYIPIPSNISRKYSNSSRKLSTVSRNRRRSSIRSKISISTSAKDSTNVPFIEDYSSDLSKRTIDDFKEINILGIGQYGRVYLVQDIFTKKLYAKKTIKKAKISINEKLLKTHKNEREILSSINHPSIVKLFYTFHDLNYINFILEYIPGGEIFYHLSKRKTFNENDTAFYLAELSQAIYHLHTVAGVVYRDLKPENVLLNSKGHVVLTDFGLSSLDEVCHSILGTPQFTAPEVLKGEEYSYPADWWSFGIMMYDMLIGETPFLGNNRTTIFNKILKMKKINLPNYLSEDAKDLLRKLLNKNPNKRMKIDQDFKILQKHRFFRKIDWDNLRKIKPPIIPDTNDLTKANNFDHDYINEILNKEETKKNSNSLQDFDIQNDSNNELFQGFSFVASKNFLETHM